MPLAAILALATAALSLARTLIEKFVPSRVTPAKNFKSKQKVIDWHNKTIKQIADYGRRKGITL